MFKLYIFIYLFFPSIVHSFLLKIGYVAENQRYYKSKNICYNLHNSNEEKNIDDLISLKVKDYLQSNDFKQWIRDEISKEINIALNDFRNLNEKRPEDLYTDEDLISTRKLLDKVGVNGISTIDKRLMQGYVPALKQRKDIIVKIIKEHQGSVTEDVRKRVEVLRRISPLSEPANQGLDLIEGKFEVLTSPSPLLFGKDVSFKEFISVVLPGITDSQKTESLEKLLMKVKLDSCAFDIEKNENESAQSKAPLVIKTSFMFSGEEGLSGKVLLSGQLSPASKNSLQVTYKAFSILMDKTPGPIKEIFKALGLKNVGDVWRLQKLEQNMEFYVIYLDQSMLLMAGMEGEDVNVSLQDNLIVSLKGN